MHEFLNIVIRLLSRAAMVLFLMPVVNCAKCIVARREGDDTAAKEGFITLDPRVHLDPIGALATLAVGFGWSKPMPISPVRMRNYKRGVILISLTGPVTHFLLAIAFGAVEVLLLHLYGVSGIGIVYYLSRFFGAVSMVDTCLGVVALLPLPPLDGFMILHQFAGRKFNRWYFSNHATIQKVSQIIIWALFLMPVFTDDFLDPLGWLVGKVGYGLSFAYMWIPGVLGR